MVVGDARSVVGTISMDALAVRLPGPRDVGTPVTLVGDGLTLETHARVAGTIAYELACAIRSEPGRATRKVPDVIDKVACDVALQAERHAVLEATVRRLLAPLRGDERALDVGCGTGALAYALASHVGEVVGVDGRRSTSPRRERARRRTARSRSQTRRRFRSPTATSTSSAVLASSITCVDRSSSSPSWRA